MCSADKCVLPTNVFCRQMCSADKCVLPTYVFYRQMCSADKCVLPTNVFCRQMCSAKGIITMGFFNARHLSWDGQTNTYGEILTNNLNWEDFTIKTTETPTFIAANGCSKIIFMVISSNLTGKITNICTDELANLATGAPTRGHVPVWATLLGRKSRKANPVVEKLDLQSMNWLTWTTEIEEQLAKGIEEPKNEAECYKLWDKFRLVIETSTTRNCQTKRISPHSKPYWTEELSAISRKMRKALKSYLTRNTDNNLEDYRRWKEVFEKTRKKALGDHLSQETSNPNRAQAEGFWKQLKRMTKANTSNQIESLWNDRKEILSGNVEIEHEMFETFFEAKHIEHNEKDFDKDFFIETNNRYEELKLNDFKGLEETISDLNDTITEREVSRALQKYKCTAKSFDNAGFYPSMLRRLGANAIQALTHLFNGCFETGSWVWRAAKIIFLRKEGKTSYASAGAYRPISITPFIGKVLEKILTERLAKHLNRVNVWDRNQEGFSRNRNTIRYLNRLVNQIKDEKQSKRETVCLFIDFEKAYDSEWKKGLAVKLWGKRVTGKFMNLLDGFMNNREIQLQVNGMKGPNQKCGEYGLPQGSVISPILFKFFLHDFGESFDDRNNIAIYKFADDGTVKVLGNKLEEARSEMKIVMKAIDTWTKWRRMVINCQKDKTELIHFSPAAKQQQPLNTIPLGKNSIQYTSATKVLGVCIDNKLSFEDHSGKMAKKMCNRWRMITRLTNRTNGLNHQVIVKLIKTTFLPILLYGCIVWKTTKNIRSINGIWYEIVQRSIGAIYNVNQSIAEVFTGLPPLSIWNKMNSFKYYLKTFQQSEFSKYDVYMDYITKKLSGCPGSTIAKVLKDMVRFLEWKRTERPECFTEVEHSLMEEQKSNLSRLVYLSSNCYLYDRSLIAKYSEILWQESINNT